PGASGGVGLREDARRPFAIEWRRVPGADLCLEVNRAAAHHGASPHEGGSDRPLVPARLDLEAESERSVCPLESRRQVSATRIDESWLGGRGDLLPDAGKIHAPHPRFHI